MSNRVSGTLSKAAPRHEAIRALLRAGDNDEAIVQLCAIIVSNPDDLAARELLFDAFFQKRDWAPALVLAEELNRRQPGTARLQKALIATLSNMKRFQETIAQAQPTSHSMARTSPSSTRSRWRISIPARPLKRSATDSARSTCATRRPAAIRRRSP